MRSYFATAARALATSLGNVFRKPVTVEFPQVIRPRAERYRASFALLHDEDGDEACIGCLQCERICPSQVISIKAGGKRESPITGKKRGYADDFVLDLNACIYCELCVQVCPTDAIVMTRVPELPAYGREDLVLTMPKLYENEKAKPRAWGDATRLNGMQTPPKPEKPAAAAAPRPVAASAPGAPAAAAGTAPAASAPATPAAAAGSVPAASTTPSPVTGVGGSTATPASPAPAAAANAPGTASATVPAASTPASPGAGVGPSTARPSTPVLPATAPAAGEPSRPASTGAPAPGATSGTGPGTGEGAP